MPVPRKRLPPIPQSLFSLLGPVPVSTTDTLRGQQAMGQWSGERREVTLLPGMTREATWQTLCHEIAHIALWDAGAHNLLDDKTEEAIVDAIGTYLVAALKAGYITIKG